MLTMLSKIRVLSFAAVFEIWMPVTIGFTAVVRRSMTLFAQMITLFVLLPDTEIPVTGDTVEATVFCEIVLPAIVEPSTLLPSTIPFDDQFVIVLFCSTTFELVKAVAGTLIPVCVVVIALFWITVFVVFTRVGWIRMPEP